MFGKIGSERLDELISNRRGFNNEENHVKAEDLSFSACGETDMRRMHLGGKLAV